MPEALREVVAAREAQLLQGSLDGCRDEVFTKMVFALLISVAGVLLASGMAAEEPKLTIHGLGQRTGGSLVEAYETGAH